ncbi:Hydrolase alpha/beta domain protein [Trichostrongylus colubriformis]|uniref:Hydrolase alpha/beta domain protein n=1 Tax=Trichostrongylus colubriformis TaxID=6319 RepID=A0AAN8G3C0_TRICO
MRCLVLSSKAYLVREVIVKEDRENMAGRELCGDVHTEVVKDDSSLVLVRISLTDFHNRSEYLLQAALSLSFNDYLDVFKDFENAQRLRVMEREICPAHDRVWSDTRDHKSQVLKTVSRALHVVGGVFYIIYPPWPPWIIHKIAFRAPSRGQYYFLIGGEQNNRQAFFSATEAEGSPNLQLCLPHLLRKKVKAVDIYYHLLRCKADIADFLKCDLLVFDYPGYGVSDGESTEKSVYDSVERVYKYAINDLGYAPKDIILIGFSLGTAAMVHIASITPDIRIRFKSLIRPETPPTAQAPPVPAIKTPAKSSAWRPPQIPVAGGARHPEWQPSKTHSSYDKAQAIKCPTLVCHGKDDAIVDHHHGLAMKERIANSELFLIPASHQGIFCERKMWDNVNRFIRDKVHITAAWVEAIRESTSDISGTIYG